MLGAVRRCGSEAKSKDRKLQCVGGTHAAQLGLAIPALARRLGPVCLKSLRKGHIKDRARGHSTAYTLSEAVHMYIYACKHKETQNAFAPLAPIDCFWCLSLLLQFQSPHNKGLSSLAKHLVVGKCNSSLRPKAGHNKQQDTMCGFS